MGYGTQLGGGALLALLLLLGLRLFDRRRFPKNFLVLGLALLLAVSGVVLGRQYMEDQARNAKFAEWSTFFAGVELTQLGTPDSAVALEATAKELGAADAGAPATDGRHVGSLGCETHSHPGDRSPGPR